MHQTSRGIERAAAVRDKLHLDGLEWVCCGYSDVLVRGARVSTTKGSIGRESTLVEYPERR